MVEHQVGEADIGVAPGEVLECCKASQRPLLGVADEVDAVDARRIATDLGAVGVEGLHLPADRCLGAAGSQIRTGGVAEGDPGVGERGHQAEATRAAGSQGKWEPRRLNTSGENPGVVQLVVPTRVVVQFPTEQPVGDQGELLEAVHAL